VKLGEIGKKMAASTAHNIELMDESNTLVQCQENIKLNASEILKPFGKYTICLIQHDDESEPPTVLPLIVGATAVAAFTKKK
jgi:hypothetical protein